MRTAMLALALLLAPALPALAETRVDGASKLAKLHFLKATILESKKDYAAALQEYGKAFSYDDKAAFVCRQAAKVALEIDDIEAAKTWVHRLVALDPDALQTKLLDGRVLWNTGDLDGAEKAFEAALKLDPASSETVLSLGSLLSSRSPEKAKQLFQRYMKENPEDEVEGHYQIGQIEARAGNHKEAEKRLRQAMELEPDSAMIRFSLAELYEVMKDTDAALEQYLEITRLEPNNAELHNHIGEIYLGRDMLDEARVKFEAAKAAAPGDPTACLNLSMIFERKGEFGQAAAQIRSSAAFKDDVWLNLRLSYFLTQAGKLKEAVAALEDAHKRWPENDEVAYYLALGYDDLRQGKQAMALLRAILGRKPDYRDARYQYAVLLEKYDRIDEAEKEFRALLKAHPNDPGLLNYLGYSLADRGLRLDDAEELIDKAVELDPKNGAFQDSLGWVYFKQGRSTEAVHELEGAVAKLPDDGTIWDHLGDAQSKAGDSRAAWRAWMRSLALDPANPKFAKKASRAAEKLPPGELGGLFMEHLSRFQGSMEKYSGLCDVKMSFLGKAFSYNGVLTARGPELAMDILGPLFMPIMRARFGEDGFTMDPIRIEGIRTEDLMEEASRTFEIVRDYLSGSLFRSEKAAYGKSWFSQWIELPNGRLVLSADGLRAERFEPKEKDGIWLTLGDFILDRGRQVPTRLVMDGKGFRLSLKMKGVKVEFK